MDEFYLKDLKYEGTPLRDMEYIDIVENQIRLFYLPRVGTLGFDFYAVGYTGCVCDKNNQQPNDFDKPDCMVECLYHGNVSFDGMRHLYMGHEDTDNYGYLYYADLNQHILIFKALISLIPKYCNSAAL